MRILLVEDEHRIANSIKKGLEQETYAVDVAYDGEEGYDLAVSEDYDVIVLDWLLPKMEGVEICSRLRKENIHTPILILTAKGQLEDKLKGLDNGADDYLIKPFAFEELVARIRALSRRPKDVLGNILTVADLTLNTQTFEVIRNSKLIKLSQKEFALLEYLMRHKNRIVTKDQIIQHVWNYDSDILPNTVEAFIGYLRKKIDKPYPKSSSLIQTERGFGYKIID
jgi:DNA-binding response OmpR family regulator